MKKLDSTFLIKGLVRNGEHVIPAFLPDHAEPGMMMKFNDGNTYEVVERIPRAHEKSFSMVMRVDMSWLLPSMEEIYVSFNDGEWYED